MDIRLKILGIVGIVSGVLLIPGSIFSYLGSYANTSTEIFGALRPFIQAAYIIFILLGLLASILIFNGFVILSRKLNIISIKNTSFVMIFFSCMMVSFLLFNVFMNHMLLNILIFALTGVIGMTAILFGVSLFKLRKVFGKLVISLGILYILQGVFYFLILIALLIPLTTVSVVNVLESLLFIGMSANFMRFMVDGIFYFTVLLEVMIPATGIAMSVLESIIFFKAYKELK